MVNDSHLCMSRAVFSILLLAGLAAGQQQSGPVARWEFDQSSGAKTRDTISGVEDSVSGYYAYAGGVSGNALRFDGYSTSVTRLAKQIPTMGSAISVAAWVAPNTYPWNWVPVVDYQDEQQGGYFFGIDAEGHVGMSVEAADRWQMVTSEAVIPLKKWAFVVGTYDPMHGMSLYIDGKQVGHLDASGRLQAPTHPIDLLIGRIRDAVLPYCYIHPNGANGDHVDGSSLPHSIAIDQLRAKGKPRSLGPLRLDSRMGFRLVRRVELNKRILKSS